MIKLDAVINDKKLVASIQKGVDAFNKSTAGKSKLNLKINERGFRQPLGRITGDLDKFESALAASNARVIAFGASTAVIGGMTAAFKALAATTINVQKSFADINRILNVSNKEFEMFSNQLFDIAKKTATSFDDASKGALEFARQGLGLNESLKRTADALVLVRLTGVNADKAVSALTATVNAFQQSSLTTTEALNKFVAVETKFAVSARDLMDGLGRVGSAAVDAKVSFDELNAMVAAVQQQTGRGGAVIGNALKTIFTRLQRRDTLTALEAFNVQVQDVQGNILPAMQILQNFAKTYDTLTDANKSYLREQVAGVFQANILSAIVKDINSDFQVYNRALTTSAAATNEAATANARLNQTISALISQTGTELIRLQENIGKVTFEPIARAILGPFRELVTNINNLLDGEGMGSEFANGLLKGIRNIVAGPGLVAAIAVIGKIFLTTAAYISQALPTLVGITTEKQKQANLEATIETLLKSEAPVVALIAAAEGDAAKQAGILAAHAAKQEKSFKASAASTGMMATNLRLMGMTVTKAGALVPVKGAPRGAAGYVPGFAGEAADVRKGVGGVSSTSRPVHIPNFAFGKGKSGSMVANTGEYVVPNFRGSGSAVFNPAMVRANGGLPQGAKKITAAQGYVPNFSPLSAQPAMYQKALASLRVGKVTGVNTQADTLARAPYNRPDLAAKLRAGVAAKQAQKGKVVAGGKQTFSMPNSALGIGAIVGLQERSGPYNPRSAFSTLQKQPNIKNAGLSALVKSPMFAGSSFSVRGVKVGSLKKVGSKGTKEDIAARKVLSEGQFSDDMNEFMVPALGKYASSIFKGLFKDDGKAFTSELLQTKGKRVFSKSVEGGIMESALQFSGQKASRFGGDDAARFDFEEAGKISEPLLKTFFGGITSGIVRADAKRTDLPKNINTLIGKSFGTKLTADKIALYGPIARAIKMVREQNKGTKKAAGGYVPNFVRGSLMHRLRGVQGATGLIDPAASMRTTIESARTAGVFQDKGATKAFVKKFKKDFQPSGAHEAGIRDPGATAYNAAIRSITGLNRQRSVGARNEEVDAALSRLGLITRSGIGKARKGIAKEYLTLRKESGLTKGIAMQKFDSADFSNLANYGSGSNRYTLSVQGGVLRANNVRQHEYRDAKVGNISIEDHKRKQYLVMENMSSKGPVNFPSEFKGPLMEAAAKYKYRTISRSKLTYEQANMSDVQRFRQSSRGYVPSFAGGGLGAAIQREKEAGIPSSAIRVSSSPQLRTTGNPTGLGVTNTFDEPRGLRDVGLAAGGYTPNFAAGAAGAPMGLENIVGKAKWDISHLLLSESKVTKLNTELKLAANEWANNRLSTKELRESIKSLTKGMGGAAEGTKAFGREQRALLKSAKAYGKTMKPGGMGMGGMMAMMAVPMVGGMAEQAIGGRTGAAVSGGMTGGMMGGMMGGMAAGTGAGASMLTAMGAGSVAGPVGIAAGILVGASMGIAASLSATAETSGQVNQALQTLKGAIEGNAKGALLYLDAQEALGEAKTMEQLTSATLKASNALNAIGDVNLRDQLAATGTSVDDMRKVIDKFVAEQKRQMLMLTAKGAMMGAQENEALGEQMRDWRKAGKTGEGSDYQRTGRQALGGLRDIFIAEGLEQSDVQGFVDTLKGEQVSGGFQFGGISRLISDWGKGQYSDKTITDALRVAFEKKLKSGDVTEKFVFDLAQAIESGLDPDNWSSDAEKELEIFFNTYFVPMFGDKMKEIGEKAAKFDVDKGIAANYTRDLEAFLRSINETVTDYTDNLLQITEQTALRQATKQARAGFLGFRGAGAAFRETRAAGMGDIAGRRQAMDQGLFKEHSSSIMIQIEKVAKNVADLTDFRQNVMFGTQGFTGGGFQAGIDRLRERIPTTGADIKAYEDLISKLQLAFNEQKAVIDKDEKVQHIKLKALELRAKITEEEHRVAMIQADQLAVNKLLIGREEGRSKGTVATLKRGVSAPGALNFMTARGALGQQQKTETAVFDEQKRLRDKQAISEARGRLIELQNQAKINRVTSQLVESNLQLKTSIDALNATMGGGPTTGGTGAAGGAPRGGAGLAGGGDLTVTGKPKGLFKFGDKEVLEKAAIAKAAKAKKDARTKLSQKYFTEEGMRGVAPPTYNAATGKWEQGDVDKKVARKDDPRFKRLYAGGLEKYQARLNVPPELGPQPIYGGAAAAEKRQAALKAAKQFQLQASLDYDQFGEPIDKRYKWEEASITAARTAGIRPDVHQNIRGAQKWRIVDAAPARRSTRPSGRLGGMVAEAHKFEREGLEKQIKHLRSIIPRDFLGSQEQRDIRSERQKLLRELMDRHASLGDGSPLAPMTITRNPGPSAGWQPWTMPAASPDYGPAHFPTRGKRHPGPPGLLPEPQGPGGWFSLQRAGGYGTDPEAGMFAQAEKSTAKSKAEFFEGMMGRFKGGGLEGEPLSVEQVEHINQINKEIVTAYKEGDKILMRKLELEAKSVQNSFILANQTDAINKKLMEMNQNWARDDADRTTKFTKGLEDGFAQIYREEQTLFNRLGNELPMQFKNNMVGALEATMDKTTDLGDALEGVAIEFLRTMRRAFLDSAVSNMMNAGAALVPSWGAKMAPPKQQGGFIRAQAGRFVPGRGSGDKVPLLAEPGEIVMNREAVSAVGADTLLGLNSAIPRFGQKGGNLMTLGKKLPRDWSQMSGLFLQRGNAETGELADKHAEAMEKKAAKHRKSEERKGMLTSMFASALLSGAMSWGAGKIGSWAKQRSATKLTGATVSRTGMRNFKKMGGTRGQAIEFLEAGVDIGDSGIPNMARGGAIKRQSGGFVGRSGSVARRYGSYQGGGTVSVPSGAPALGNPSNTNNININVSLGGADNARGTGASQTEVGNTGGPSRVTDSDAKALAEKIKSQVLKVIAEEQRVSGSLRPGARRP